MGVASSQMESTKKDSSNFKLLAHTYPLMGDVLSRTKPKGFAAVYNAPFFAELDKRGFTEAFVFQAFSAAKVQGAEEWCRENEAKIREFQTWLGTYQWPAAASL